MAGRGPKLILHEHGYELSGIFYDSILSLAIKELPVWPRVRLPVVRDGAWDDVLAHVKLKDIATGRVDFERLLAGEPETED
jgi:hypothetical protein